MGHYYKKLNIWIESVDLVTTIYAITKAFPNEEKFGLINQMRRASISIMSNIAEGSSRKTKKHFNHYLILSTGSLYELESQLLISKKLQYISEKEYGDLEKEITRLKNMIHAFSKKLLSSSY